MEIATVKAMKAKLEIDLRNAAHALVDDFQVATGVQVAGVSIELLETKQLGGERKSHVTGCSVILEI